MYKPIDKLLLEDLDLLSYTKKIYNNVKHLKKPYILMASSHGIYYALAFAYLYPQHVKHIISLDGSWVTKKLCKARLDKFKKQGRKSIGSQKELDQIIKEIKNNKDNDIAIKKIMEHVRLNHTIDCIKYKFENIINSIEYSVFRDYNSKIKDEIDIEFNTNAMNEHRILENKNKYKIYWLIDAGHVIWRNKNYKKQIINIVKMI
jgi:hypothetical protein